MLTRRRKAGRGKGKRGWVFLLEGHFRGKSRQVFFGGVGESGQECFCLLSSKKTKCTRPICYNVTILSLSFLQPSYTPRQLKKSLN